MSPWDLDWEPENLFTKQHDDLTRPFFLIKRKNKEYFIKREVNRIFLTHCWFSSDRWNYLCYLLQHCMTGQIIHRGNTKSRSIRDEWLQKQSSPASKRQKNHAEVVSHFQTEVGWCTFIEPVAMALFTAKCYQMLTFIWHPFCIQVRVQIYHFYELSLELTNTTEQTRNYYCRQTPNSALSMLLLWDA